MTLSRCSCLERGQRTVPVDCAIVVLDPMLEHDLLAGELARVHGDPAIPPLVAVSDSNARAVWQLDVLRHS
eukprot:1869176-Prymnesium_polylepis.1